MTRQRRTIPRRVPEMLWTAATFFCFCLPAFADWLNRG